MIGIYLLHQLVEVLQNIRETKNIFQELSQTDLQDHFDHLKQQLQHQDTESKEQTQSLKPHPFEQIIREYATND